MKRATSPTEYLSEAQSPVTSPDRLDVLAELEWEFVRAAVAENPNTNPRTLLGLTPAGSRPLDNAIALAIARRTDAPSEALSRLGERFVRVFDGSSRSSGFDLGLALAANDATPESVIEKLIDPASTTPHFRSRIASTSTRVDVLRKLAGDTSEKVRGRAIIALRRTEGVQRDEM